MNAVVVRFMSAVAMTCSQGLAIATGTWLTIAACVVVLAFPLATATAMELNSIVRCVWRRREHVHEGCTNPDACNFDPSAVLDDGSCAYLDVCGVCGGDTSSCSGCTIQRLATTMNGRSRRWVQEDLSIQDAFAINILVATLPSTQTASETAYSWLEMLSTATFNLNFLGQARGSYPADMMVYIYAPNSNCVVWGGLECDAPG